MSNSVGAYMSKIPVTIQQKDNLKKALEIMEKNSISHLVVMENKKLSGIISKTDILERLKTLILGSGGKTYNKIILNTLQVEEFMSADPVCIKESENIEKAVALLMQEKFHIIPVINEHKEPVGLLSAIDIIKHLQNNNKINY